jgi:hypothetical protein
LGSFQAIAGIGGSFASELADNTGEEGVKVLAGRREANIGESCEDKIGIVETGSKSGPLTFVI